MDRKPRTEGGPYIGRPMPRFEDLRLVRGAGKYSDDISMPGQAIAAFVRSPHAHAMVKRIDTAAARKMPGVVAVLTGADYVADGLKGAIAARQPGRRDRHQGARVRAGEAPGAGGAAVSARRRPRALSGRSGGGGDRGNAVPPRATPPKRSRSNTRCCRRSPMCAKRTAPSRSGRVAADNVALDQEFGDAAAVRGCVRQGRTGGRADLRQPAHQSIARWSRAPASPPTMRRRIPTR